MIIISWLSDSIIQTSFRLYLYLPIHNIDKSCTIDRYEITILKQYLNGKTAYSFVFDEP